MNYYKRHLGDYAKDTSWLSTYQHGVFALLLDWYYSNERAIPMNLVHRIVKARTGPEKRATDEVLQAFFDMSKEAGFAHNKHADLVLGNYKIKSEANSLIAKERESTKRARDVDDSVSDSSDSGEPSHKPLATSHKKANTPVVPKGDSTAVVVDAYHLALPKCQGAHVMNDKRLKRIKAAIKLARQVCASQGWEYGDGEAFWTAYFAECATDPWMRGEVPNPKNAVWRQNLDVLLAEDRFAGIMDKAIASMRGAE
jgi:uncharacterized protein YdaU (DUF1376 family)